MNNQNILDNAISEINSIKELTENFEKSQEILYISLWLKIKFCQCQFNITEKGRFFMNLYQRSEEIIKLTL